MMTTPFKVDEPSAGHRFPSKEAKPLSERGMDDSEELQTFRFRDLPPELRNKIYIEYTNEEENSGSFLQQPALLSTGRQIRTEALPVFFAGRHFEVCIKLTESTDTESLGSEIKCKTAAEWEETIVAFTHGGTLAKGTSSLKHLYDVIVTVNCPQLSIYLYHTLWKALKGLAVPTHLPWMDWPPFSLIELKQRIGTTKTTPVDIGDGKEEIDETVQEDCEKLETILRIIELLLEECPNSEVRWAHIDDEYSPSVCFQVVKTDEDVGKWIKAHGYKVAAGSLDETASDGSASEKESAPEEESASEEESVSDHESPSDDESTSDE